MGVNAEPWPGLLENVGNLLRCGMNDQADIRQDGLRRIAGGGYLGFVNEYVDVLANVDNLAGSGGTITGLGRYFERVSPENSTERPL